MKWTRRLCVLTSRGASKRGRIPFGFTDVSDVLERLGLLAGDALTNAADVLFCVSKDVQLKMGMFATHARTDILDLRQESGTVFSLVDAASAYILTNMRRRFVINDHGPRDEVPELPPKAVKEALMNAYAHRDWPAGGCVQIDIFADSVEILSPGWFIEGQDPDEHLSGASTSSKTRNSLIAKTLYRSGDIESYGTGIPRIRDLCAEVGVRVEYIRTPDGTKLVFHRNDAFADGYNGRVREKCAKSARKIWRGASCERDGGRRSDRGNGKRVHVGSDATCRPEQTRNPKSHRKPRKEGRGRSHRGGKVHALHIGGLALAHHLAS